jgi:diaminopimelate decarboxylase
VIVQTLMTLGCNFDCASRNEIRLVQKLAKEHGLPHAPEIIYANPTKARSHIIEAVCSGVTMMTFDNVAEVKKCASVSTKIQLILRIITDDSGSQCRLSSKYGAPKSRWRALLSAAKSHGMEVVGVSFHVGSGCRDSSRYELALKDARQLFDLAEADYGFKMKILDIGGGFPGETHSLWNPADIFGDPTAPPATTEVVRRKYTIDEEIDEKSEGPDRPDGEEQDDDDDDDGKLMFFSEIAEAIVPIMDDLFPPESNVRIIAEPGRYLVAASSTLCTSIIGVRANATTADVEPIKISDEKAAFHVDQVTRAEEDEIVAESSKPEHPVIDTIVDEIADYSKLYARLNLTQQEFDVYAEKAELTSGHVQAGAPLLAPPEDRLPEGEEPQQHHTVEGMQMGIVANCLDDGLSVISETETSDNRDVNLRGALSLAAAGEAAVSGVVIQAIADSAPCQDDYAYYVNDGCYGGFNNLIFDHATVRPRRLKHAISKNHSIVPTEHNGFITLEAVENDDSSQGSDDADKEEDDGLYPSVIFGPTCDSIDVISRSVLLPKLRIGDWLYFNNMGAYTSAAASDFNGFTPSDKFYVCSVQPEHFEQYMTSNGPKERAEDSTRNSSVGSTSSAEEKKADER